MNIDELVKFAKENHAGFATGSDEAIRFLLSTYKDCTFVYTEQGKIKGFAVYQRFSNSWYHFIAICGTGSYKDNLRAMLKGRKILNVKNISFFDEHKMQLRFLKCQ